jgi:hypothetical protein
LNHERTKDGNYRKKMKSLWVQWKTLKAGWTEIIFDQ